uniref:Glycosyl transferase family 1 n=1 Tax=uncultured Acetothermia bacterium TaxID=236499 RepID=H5SH26_9BACT|nr:glycosyl transferase family 1 [uncultured Acetothermia bacterium]
MITFFIPHLYVGGAERVTVSLIKGLVARGEPVDLVLINRGTGAFEKEIPKECRIIDLDARRALTALPSLVRYLKDERPEVLITAGTHVSIAALIARLLSRSKIPVIVTEHTIFSLAFPFAERRFTSKLLPFLMRRLYPTATYIVGVSQGVVEDLRKILGMGPEKFRVIYNAIVDEALLRKAEEPFAHPFFREGEPPVILAVGRLHVSKDYPTLLRAFALIRRKVHARLLILGDGEKRKELEELARTLSISEDLSMPGFVDNPYPYIAHAAVLVLSSRWEALSTVLVEALALGTPIVSTDCPTGPREILKQEEFGLLVPPQDPESLARAILSVLQDNNLRRILRDKGRRRAQDFSVDKAVEEYMRLIAQCKSAIAYGE